MAVDEVRAALVGIEEAFAAARRERLQLIRELGARSAPPALVDALVRREAADADTEAPLADRVARAVAERERARAIAPKVTGLIDATYTRALAQSRALADDLPGPVGDALGTYVRALAALHTEGPTALPEFERAEAALTSHLAALS